jgi:hypothetical protein
VGITIIIKPTPTCPSGNVITTSIVYTTTADPLKIFVADYYIDTTPAVPTTPSVATPAVASFGTSKHGRFTGF